MPQSTQNARLRISYPVRILRPTFRFPDGFSACNSGYGGWPFLPRFHVSLRPLISDSCETFCGEFLVLKLSFDTNLKTGRSLVLKVSSFLGGSGAGFLGLIGSGFLGFGTSASPITGGALFPSVPPAVCRLERRRETRPYLFAGRALTTALPVPPLPC